MGISFYDAQHGIAVGSRGWPTPDPFILFYSGGQWQVLPVAVQGIGLVFVKMVGPYEAWVVAGYLGTGPVVVHVWLPAEPPTCGGAASPSLLAASPASIQAIADQVGEPSVQVDGEAGTAKVGFSLPEAAEGTLQILSDRMVEVGRHEVRGKGKHEYVWHRGSGGKRASRVEQYWVILRVTAGGRRVSRLTRFSLIRRPAITVVQKPSGGGRRK
jgi:hypothetical protein